MADREKDQEEATDDYGEGPVPPPTGGEPLHASSNRPAFERRHQAEGLGASPRSARKHRRRSDPQKKRRRFRAVQRKAVPLESTISSGFLWRRLCLAALTA